MSWIESPNVLQCNTDRWRHSKDIETQNHKQCSDNTTKRMYWNFFTRNMASCTMTILHQMSLKRRQKATVNTHSHSDCGCLHYYLLPFSIVDWVAVRTMEVTKGSDKNDDMQIVCIVNIVTTYATWQTQQSCCTNLIKFKSCYRWLTNVLTKMNRVFMLYLQSQLKTCAKSNMLDDLQS